MNKKGTKGTTKTIYLNNENLSWLLKTAEKLDASVSYIINTAIKEKRNGEKK